MDTPVFDAIDASDAPTSCNLQTIIDLNSSLSILTISAVTRFKQRAKHESQQINKNSQNLEMRNITANIFNENGISLSLLCPDSDPS